MSRTLGVKKVGLEKIQKSDFIPAFTKPMALSLLDKSDLPLVMNDQVAMFINYYSSPRGKATLEHAWTRAGRYREMIESVLKEEGVPQDQVAAKA